MAVIERDTKAKTEDKADSPKSLPAVDSLDSERKNALKEDKPPGYWDGIPPHLVRAMKSLGMVRTAKEAEAQCLEAGIDVVALREIGTTKPIPMNLPPGSVVLLPTSLRNTDLSNADLSRTYITQDDQFVKISDAILKIDDKDLALLISNVRFSRTNTKWSSDPATNDAVNQRISSAGLVASTVSQGEAEAMDHTFDDILSKKAVGRVDESLLNKHGIMIAKSESEKTTVPRFVSEQEAERQLLRGELKPKKKAQPGDFGQDDR